MKSLLCAVIVFVFPVFNLFAQHTFGIYKTAEDYRNNIFFITLQSDSCNAKIHSHFIFQTNYIDVIHNGTKTRFCKDSIFGYRDKQQRDFRINRKDGVAYEILENKSIVIYRIFVSVPNSTGKTNRLVPEYYFSTSLDGEIIPLSIINLKKAFPGNLALHDAIDVAFGDGTPLSFYDDSNKMYKVNFILSQFQK